MSKTRSEKQYSQSEPIQLILGEKKEKIDSDSSHLKMSIRSVDKTIEEYQNDFNMTDSQLMNIAEMPLEEEKKTDLKLKSPQQDFDYNSLDLEGMFKSAIKNQSPIRNLNLKNNNFTYMSKCKEVEERKEKLIVNLSQSGFELPEEELRNLLENIMTQRRIPEESARKEASEKKENKKFENLIPQTVQQVSYEKNHDDLDINMRNKSKERNKSGEHSAINAINVVGFLIGEFSQFFNQLDMKFRNNFSRSEIKSQPVMINQDTANRLETKRILSDFNIEKVKSNNISNDYKNANHFSSIKSAKENAKQINPFTSAKNVSELKINTKDPNEICMRKSNNFSTGNDINDFDLSKFSKEDFSNLNCEDEEFDDFLKNIKANKTNNKDNNANYKAYVNDKSSQPFKIANNNSNNNIKNINKSNNIDNSNKLIEDEEFDNFLMGMKNNKNNLQTKTSVNGSLNHVTNSFKPPVNKSSTNPNLNVKETNHQHQTNSTLIQSDFMCGNKNVSFKADNKYKQLIEEMQKDCEDEFDVSEELNKITKTNENNNTTNISKINSNYNNNNNNNILINQTKPIKTFKPPKLINPIKNLSSSSKRNPSSKKIRINEFSSEKLNSKRLYSEHIKTLDPDTKKNNLQINNKKFKSNGTFKYADEKKIQTTNKGHLFNSQSDPIEKNPISNFYIENIERYKLYCCDNKICNICNGYQVTIHTFVAVFINYVKVNANQDLSKKMSKSHEDFLNYQFRLVTWKYWFISRLQNKEETLILTEVLRKVYQKFNLVFEEGKRSLLTKVAEKDSSINRNMVLLVMKISKENESFIIELSDGYKSVFSCISPSNPITNLINKNLIIPGMKLNIGLAKVDKIGEDFSIFINIYYNSISKAKFEDKLGVQKGNKFMLKNLANIREDGGEVSLIDIIIVKKYDFYCQDFSKKEKFSALKLEKIIEDYNEIFSKEEKNVSEQKFPYENLTYHFKITCIDSLLYLSSIKDLAKDTCQEFDLNLKQSLKNKLIKKCTIDFSVKNKEIFEMLKSGNRYQLALLNIKANNSNKSYNPYHDPKWLKLKANDQILIKEIKNSGKGINPNIHQRVLQESSKVTNLQLEDRDVSDYLKSNNFQWTNLTNEEVSFSGMFIRVHRSPNKSLYLFFLSVEGLITLIKLHDENFFDLSKIFKLNSHNNLVNNPFYTFKNLNFQIVYYYDMSVKSLGTFKNDKKYEKNFEDKCIVIYLESSNYTTMKSVSLKETKRKEIIKSYDEMLITEIIKCI